MTHHPECEDATGEYPGSCTCATIKRREAMDDRIAQAADLIDLVGRLRRTYRKEFAATGSTVGDISNRLRPFPILATEVLFNPDGLAAAERIEALSAENERLREALEWYVAEDEKYIRAALASDL